jgi:AmmeMemoRadiSam system protein A
MSIACAALMCHAPIVIPVIAGADAHGCKRTTQAMQEIARTLVQHAPGLIVLISPHAPRRPRSVGLVFDASLFGDFARFGHAEVSLCLRGAPTQAERVALHAKAEQVATHAFQGADLDHGSMVPLFFLHEAGYRGRVLLASLPYPGSELEARFGRALDAAALESEERWAVLASGDMSHRLTRSAPAGFEPRAREFDRSFVRAIDRGDLRAAVSPDPELVELAAEDVLQATAVAAASVRYRAQGTRVIAYEAPFGVGYLEALLFSQPVPTEQHEASRLPAALIQIALDAIAHALADLPFSPPSLEPPWQAARPLFVTLRAADGELRGCIGRTEPRHASLAAEVADCAVGAATRDFRMPSVRLEELHSLQVEISLLYGLEPVQGSADLDPARFGIVVEHGAQRGVLLPDVEGIESATEQLQVALRKAGIADSAPYRVRRFAVDKVSSAAHDPPRHPPFSQA